MPNYNITIDSKFDPYSFEDYLKPAMLMQEQHNALAEAYAESLARSASLADALNSTGDTNDAVALQAVNDYENNINKLSADLAQNGLNRANRRGIYDAKSKYGYIDSLKKAMDNRNTFIAKQNELALADPTRRFSDYASNHGITRFINPDFTYGSFSGAAIQKQTEDLIKNYAESAYIQDPNNPQYKHFSGLTYMIQQKTGATPEQIQKAMDLVRNGVDINSMSEKDKNIVTQLAEAANQVVTEHLGNYEWDEDNLTYAKESAAEGLRKALGSYSIKPFNVEEPKVTASSKAPNSATPLSMRYNQLYFGDSAKDRTGMTNVFERFYTDQMNKTFQRIADRVSNMSPSEFKKYSQEHNKELRNMMGLNTTHRDFFNLVNPEKMRPQIDGVDVTIAVAERMGLGEDVVNELNELHSKIKSTFNGQYARYEPTQNDVKLFSKVWNEYNRRNNEADALHALSFELPFTSTDNHEVLEKLLGSNQAGYTTDWRNKWREIKEIKGYDEDGYAKLGDSLLKGDVDTSDNYKKNTVSFSAVPMEVKVKDANGKKVKDEDGNDVVKNTMRFIMHLNGKMYEVPEKFIPENLRPNLSQSVSNYIDTQMEYDLWAKDKDFNNLSDQEAMEYANYNSAIGYGSQSMGRQAAIALFGPNWAFDKQKVLH